jgi:hypothetical protein
MESFAKVAENKNRSLMPFRRSRHRAGKMGVRAGRDFARVVPPAPPPPTSRPRAPPPQTSRPRAPPPPTSPSPPRVVEAAPEPTASKLSPPSSPSGEEAQPRVVVERTSRAVVQEGRDDRNVEMMISKLVSVLSVASEYEAIPGMVEEEAEQPDSSCGDDAGASDI